MTRSLIFMLAATTIASAAEGVERAPSHGTFLLWRAPKPMTESDWVWGPGGRDQAPVPPFVFLKENRGGTNPKVDVRDANGALWTVKFGGEVHTEVFASRLLQAAGYAAEATYYVADGVIEGATDLHRAKPFIGKDGQFKNARFKLRDTNLYYADDYQWSWTENPFVGTRPLNGLRILMMLVSNWDAKDARDREGSNTAVFLQRDTEDPVYLYAMNDWGASMGSWGGFFKRDRWNAAAYQRQTPEFVKGVKDGIVIWGYEGKHGRDITGKITVEDVRWLMTYLSAISEEDLRLAMRASGATPALAELYGRAVRTRLDQLQLVSLWSEAGKEGTR